MAKVKLKGRSLTRGRENQYSVEDVEVYDSGTRVSGRLLENGRTVRSFDVQVKASRFKVDTGTGSGVKVEFSTLSLAPMSYQRIGLARTSQRWGDGLVPSEGEELGNELERAAEQNRKWADMGERTESGLHFMRLASMLLYLAADAYDFAQDASIGHNRSDRYREKAANLRKRATELVGLESERRAMLNDQAAMRRISA